MAWRPKCACLHTASCARQCGRPPLVTNAPAPAHRVPRSGTAAPAPACRWHGGAYGMQGEALRGPDVHLRPAQPLLQGVRLVRLQHVLRPLRGQGPSFLQQAQHPMTHHPQHLIHLTLRGRRQRLQAHTALPRHEDAVRHQRVEVRRDLQGGTEELPGARPAPRTGAGRALPRWPPPAMWPGCPSPPRTAPSPPAAFAGTPTRAFPPAPPQPHLARAHATVRLPRAPVEPLPRSQEERGGRGATTHAPGGAPTPPSKHLVPWEAGNPRAAPPREERGRDLEPDDGG
jgi:hypothetical protein